MAGLLLFVALVAWFALCVYVCLLPDWDEATGLHLQILGRCHMAKIGDQFTARIAPKNVAGAEAPVFEPAWSVDGTAYTVAPAPDGYSAILTAVEAGPGVVRVSAKSISGNVLNDMAVLQDVAPPVDEEAVTLGLTVA